MSEPTTQQIGDAGRQCSSALLGFGDALRIARGCHDYSGGHHTDGHYDAYHHGIQTVINVLEAAEKAGLNDTQVAAVWCIGVCTHRYGINDPVGTRLIAIDDLGAESSRSRMLLAETANDPSSATGADNSEGKI